MLAVFAALGAATGRGIAWWPFVAAVVVAPWIPELVPDTAIPEDVASRKRSRRPPSRVASTIATINRAIVAVILTVMVALLPIGRPVGAAGLPLATVAYAPQPLTRALRDAVASGAARSRVWNPQRLGSWLEFAVPEMLYATDSRIELYPSQVWRDADIVASGAGDWAAVLARYRVTYVVTEPVSDAALEAALASGTDPTTDWIRTYWGCDGSIWSGQPRQSGGHFVGSAAAPSCP
jgi:hypothetical protein